MLNFFIILPRVRKNTFTTILCSWWLNFPFCNVLFLFKKRKSCFFILLHHLSMNQNLSALLRFGDIILNLKKFSILINHSKLTSKCLRLWFKPTNTSSIGLPTGINSILPVPGNISQSHSFESLPIKMIFSQLIGEGFP